jgi:hypothetical protein
MEESRLVGGFHSHLPLPGAEDDEFRLKGFEGDSDILRGDLSSQVLVPWGLERLVDDIEGSNPDSCWGDWIEGDDPKLCVVAKYRGSGGIKGISEFAEAPRLWPCP